MASLAMPDIELGGVTGIANASRTEHRSPTTQVERIPSGYPQFSALIASHDDFHLCRRFTDLRSRLLLFKQDKLSALETQLWNLDEEEKETFSLGTYRGGNSDAREQLLAKIDEALADYDQLVVRNHQMLGFESPRPQAVSSLQNWIRGTGNIARRESEYLKHSCDLLGAAVADDTILAWLEQLTEKILIALRQRLGWEQHQAVSNDARVHIFSKTMVKRATRVLMTPFIVTLILAPVIICNRVHSVAARFLTVVVAATVFVAVLSGSTRAKTIELVVACATYTTVLIVFISSNMNVEV